MACFCPFLGQSFQKQQWSRPLTMCSDHLESAKLYHRSADLERDATVRSALLTCMEVIDQSGNVVKGFRPGTPLPLTVGFFGGKAVLRERIFYLVSDVHFWLRMLCVSAGVDRRRGCRDAELHSFWPSGGNRVVDFPAVASTGVELSGLICNFLLLSRFEI